MKRTLLDMVQDILSSLDSDEVNSIEDTDEAMQVARVLRTAYYDIVSRANLPEHYTLFELDASGDIDKPTVMHLPNNLNNLLWIKYDKRELGETAPLFRQVIYKNPEDFLEWTLGFNLNDSNVSQTVLNVNGGNIEVLYKTDVHPTYFTSYDDRTVIFDSYDSEVDGTLVKNKTMAYGVRIPSFLFEDSFVPDLDANQFNLLFQEGKALAFAELKQTEHARAERSSRRGWITLQRNKTAIPSQKNTWTRRNNFGRK